ncbi:pyrimidine reductase family protein [Kribbella sp. NPDC051770]|uniref:pyrimidine reductase family protein n=1 Tax=Kribbella sp. NPDC051770 TaxID=3155413 RepID=UPI0034253662
MRKLSELTEAEVLAAYQVEDRSVPHLRSNFVTTLDGAVEIDGKSKALSGASDQEVFGKLRMLSDVILVGAGTVRDEHYNALRLGAERRAWRLEHGLAENPTLALVSSRLDLDPKARYLADAPVRPIIFTNPASPAEAREALAEVADVVVCGHAGVDLHEVVATLVERGLPQILTEGGPHLQGALTEADLIDEMCLSLAPMLAGPGSGRITAGPAATSTRSYVLHSALAGDDGYLFFRYLREA